MVAVKEPPIYRSRAAAGTGAGVTQQAGKHLPSDPPGNYSSCQPPDVEVDVEQYQLRSGTMPDTVHWGLALPSSKAEAILLCLHGLGGSHRFAFDTIGVHRFVAKEQLPWAVVSVDGGATSYWHQRADGSDPQAMVFHDLLPDLRTRLGPVPLVLLGWSMGGYGALLAATDHPQEVSGVAAVSPALWRSHSQAHEGAFDGDSDFRAHDLFRRVVSLRRLAVRIDCGDYDAFAATSRALAEQLPGAETGFGRGSHDATTWQGQVQSQLAFFSRVLPR